jgi:hypothetical protein
MTSQSKISKIARKCFGASGTVYYFVMLGDGKGVFVETVNGLEEVNMKAAIRDCDANIDTQSVNSRQAFKQFLALH